MRKAEPHLLRTFRSVHPYEQTTTTVVFFLGGCTYTEIAALRWVARQNRGEMAISWWGVVLTVPPPRTDFLDCHHRNN